LKKFSACEIKKTPRGAMVEFQQEGKNTVDQEVQTKDMLSYIFGLLLMYGKFDAKK